MSSSTVSSTTSTTDVVKTDSNQVLNEKGALAYSTSTDSRVDFFFHAVRKLPKADTQTKLEAAYKEYALDALKLVFQSRDCRGGKGERQLFRDCMDWLCRNHPKQVLANIELIPEYGRFEDLLWLMNEQDYSADIVRAAVQIFAKQLKKDVEQMNEGKPCSLAAKWAPTEKASHDRKLHVVNQICRELGVNKKDYRKKYVSPLREYLRVVERYMCLGQWDKIDFSKVPSLAMNKLKKAFEKHEPERFKEWKAALERGDEGVKVNASVIEPHELVRQYMNQSKEKDTVVEEQWKEVLARVAGLGSMNKTLVLSDVSGSMSGTPMEVSIALGLLISTLTAKPFQGLVITFHETPTFFNVQGDTLREQVHSLMAAPWGGSTQLGKAFDLILDLAQKNKVKAEDMPERLVIISDMQFDVIEGYGHKPSLDGIRAKYEKAGYKCPQIVFWNVRATGKSAPATADDKDVALLSGYSPSIMKALLEGELEQFTPYGIMRKTLDDKRYAAIKLADE